MSLSVINHRGIVHTKEKGKVRVKIISVSACASCQIKGVCTISDTEDKIIDVFTDDNYEIGEAVTVYTKRSVGFKAVWLGYVLPFLLVLSTLILMLSLQYTETVSGLASLFILVPYYIFLYLYKDILKKRFTFKILK